MRVRRGETVGGKGIGEAELEKRVVGKEGENVEG